MRAVSLSFLMVLALVTSNFAALIPNQTASAAGSLASGFTPDQEAQSYVYYRSLGACTTYDGSNLPAGAGVEWHTRISRQDAKSGNWFTDAWGFSTTTTGVYLDGTSGVKANDVGTIDCSQTGLVDGALKLWGNWAPDEALCAMGFRSANDGEFNAGRCTNAQGGSDDFRRGSNVMAAYQKAVKDHVYGGKDPTLSDAAKYLLYLKTFQKLCAPSATISQAKPIGSTDRDYAIRQPARSGSDVVTPTTYYTGSSNKAQGDIVSISPGSDFSTLLNLDAKSCGDLAKAINGDPGKNNGLADAYAKWLHDHTAADISGGSTICAAGATIDPVTGKPCSTTSTSSCAIDGVGWIICPILTAGAGLADGAYKFLADAFLSIDTKLVGPDTLTAWKIMQSIANVLFIPVFLWMIYLLMTGSGNSNRLAEFRKIFLRLIIMAILTNISFFICQVAVDLSNILGYSLKDLLGGVAKTITLAAPDTTVKGDDSTNILGIVATALVVGSAVWINIGAVLVALVGALVSLLVIFFMLAMRQALIVLLIVVAPIAFVAYVLPNTQSLFDKWRKMITGLLLVFPVIGLVYGACLVAHAILWNVAQGAGDNKTIMEVIAYMALVVPLIVTIPLLKSSLGAVGNLGGTINGMRAKLAGVAGKSTQKGYENSRLGQFKRYREGENARRRALVQSGQFRGSNANPRNWFRNPASKVNQGINAVTGQFGDRATAEGISLANKAEAESVGFQEQALRRQGIANPNAARIALDKAVRSGDAVAAKAAQNVLFTQGAAGMNAFHSTIAAAESDGHLKSNAASALRENINANHGQMVKTKAADISKWAALGGSLQGHTRSKDSWAGMSQSDLAGQTGDSLERGAKTGGIDAQTAATLLNNTQLNGGLDDKQKAALRQAAGEASSSGSGGNAPTPSPGPIGAESIKPSGWLPPDFPEAPGAVPHESFTDEQGRRTPSGASDDYHDRMTK